MSPIVLGSIIEGTLRPQDLFPKFLETLKQYNWTLWEQWTNPTSPDYVELPKTDDDEWWNSNECTSALNDLTEALNKLAPKKCYFGTHPINHLDFGFWAL